MRPKLADVYDKLYDEGLSDKPLPWDRNPVIRDETLVWLPDSELTPEDRFEQAEQFMRLAGRESPYDPKTATLDEEIHRINARVRNEKDGN